MKTKSVSIRIPVKDFQELNRLSDIAGIKRSIVIRDVLRRGIKEKKLEWVMDKFRKNEITLWKAARIAEIPLTKFLDILDDEGLEYHYGYEEVEKEFEELI